MPATRDTLIAWLRDAHAMENQAIEILKRQSERTDDFPKVKQKITEHLEQSRSQQERVKRLLDRFDADTSVVKEGIGKFMGNASALTNAAAGDELVKNGLADYAFEAFEMASYRALIAAADALGENEVKRVCEEILQEEEAMFKWLEENLPDVTKQYLAREQATA